MIFTKPVALELCELNSQCYALATTGHCVLPDGFTAAIPIRLPAAERPFLLHDDPLDIFGYATSKDGVITLVFRGTEITTGLEFLQEWAEDLLSLPLVPFGLGHVHLGFHAAWRELAGPTSDTIRIAAYAMTGVDPGIELAGCRLRITGHSLGAAIATLCWAEFGGDLMSIASPRVGDEAFATSLWDGQTVRLFNAPDIVPDVPTDPPFRHGGYPQRVRGPGGLLERKMAHRLSSYVIGINALEETS